MQNCRLCLFDLGNVLVGNIQILPEMSRRLGIPYRSLEADYHLYERALMAGLFDIEDYYLHLEEKFSVSVEGDPFRECFHPEVNTVMVELVDRLRENGVRCAIASNTFESHWIHVYESSLAGHFDALYASHLIHAVKPDESFYRTILSIEDVSARYVEYVDDMVENIMAAGNLGISSCLYSGDDLSLWMHFGLKR